MPLAAKLCLLDPIVTYLVITGLFLGFSWLGLLARGRWLPHGRLAGSREVAGILFSGIAVLYAVILAFVVLGEWENFDQATQSMEAESGALLCIILITKSYPHPTPAIANLQRAVRTYLDRVIQEEYPAMQRMRPAPGTQEAFQRIWTAADTLVPATAAEANIQRSVFQYLGQAQGARANRLLMAIRGLPSALWVVIVLGAVVTMGFSLFLSTERFWTQVFLNFGLGSATALVIYAIVELNYPFIGTVSVATEGYEYALSQCQDPPAVPRPAQARPGGHGRPIRPRAARARG
jgi:hypothetical protein